ncbi:PapD-like protein [Pholiota conissans]|uniref:PapD-like protein n=1 Tax=Pholiota conissans TaxID=109636 RepID=A0A9P6CR23_9AGAR|nr:PapD-like protein [Pholiota conissans]
MSQSVSLNPSSVLGFRRPFTTKTKCALTVTNNDQQSIAFIVKTTAPKLYCVRPNRGRIEPGKSIDLIVVKGALKDEPPRDTKCKDKFLVQWTAIISGERDMHVNDIWTTRKRDDGRNVFERKLGIEYLNRDDTSIEGGQSGDPGSLYGILDNAFILSDSTLGVPRRDFSETIQPIGGEVKETDQNEMVYFFPNEALEFRRPLTKFRKCVLTIKNHNERPIAFKVKTTAPNLYCALPNSGRIEPRKTIDITVSKKPHKEEPPLDAKCKDKFLIQTAVITPEMESMSIPDILSVPMSKEEGRVLEKRLRIKYLTRQNVSADKYAHKLSVCTSSQDVLRDEQQGELWVLPSGITDELVSLFPSHNLTFRRPLTENTECLLIITNKMEDPVAFKIKPTHPELYCTRPNSSRLEPAESINVSITLQKFEDLPVDTTKCKDMFLVLSTVITPDKRNTILQDIWNNPDMQEEHKIVRQKLGVVYLPAEKQADEDTATRASFSRFRKWMHNRIHSTGN